MIRQLARWYAEEQRNQALAATGTAPPDDALQLSSTASVFSLNPLQLLRFLEEVWAYRDRPADRPDAAIPDRLLYGQVPGLESGIRNDLTSVVDDIYVPPLTLGTVVDGGIASNWDHLIYAYLIENTRIYDIFRRVLFEYLSGERLEVPSPITHRWLRIAEDLFYRDLPSGSIGSVTSSVRPDLGGTRRNAYYRMFGIDLNHGRDDGQAYSYVRPTATNKDFVPTFEDFLREVWIASENWSNTSGTNPKDDAAIARYARDMQDMLTTRRRNGNLSREEFFIVTMLSWFHLTVESDNDVIIDLKSTATSPEERLRKVGERVGLPPHVHSESFFILAPRMSTLFTRLERGDYSSPGTVQVLYANPPGPPNPIRKDMLDIINQWSIATGRDMKARRTTITPRTATVAVGAGSRNGATVR